MFEVWICKEEPKVRLVIPEGGALPMELGSRDWKRLGPYRPSPEIAEKVRVHGWHFFDSDEPIPDSATLKNANAAGA